MPKFINKTQAAALAAIEAALPEGLDLSGALAAEGGIVSAIAPAPAAAEPTEAQCATIITDFLTSQGVELAAEATAEDSLAALLGAQESFGICADTLSAHGIDLAAVVSAEDPAAELKSGIDALVATKSASLAAQAGLSADDLPETPEGEPGNEPQSEADFLTAISKAEASGDTAQVDALYASMREAYPRTIS